MEYDFLGGKKKGMCFDISYSLDKFWSYYVEGEGVIYLGEVR